ALARAVDVLHQRNIAHGDLHADNLLVHRRGTVVEGHLIDLDNFNAPNLPPPPCVGHNLYMAPELRQSSSGKMSVLPDILADCFSLTVLLHEIILVRHPAAGADASEADFNRAMCTGAWRHDPARAARGGAALGGFPAEVLNAGLMRLFRRGMSLDRGERPTAAAWVTE